MIVGILIGLGIAAGLYVVTHWYDILFILFGDEL